MTLMDDDNFHVAKVVPLEEGPEGVEEAGGTIRSVRPDVRLAREYYENQLPRRVRDALQPTGFRLNVPGEMRSSDGDPATLYNPWAATQDMIADFGIGIDLYFLSLRRLNVLFFLVSFISLIAITENSKFNCDDTPGTLIGSTYCAHYDSLYMNRQGLSNILCTVLITLGLWRISWTLTERYSYLKRNAYSTSDYSVVITNPSIEIQDPDVYRDHFKQWGDVVLVTIAKNNGDLLSDISEKKAVHAQLDIEKTNKSISESNHRDYKDEKDLAWPLKYFIPTITSLQRKLDFLTAKIDANIQKDYHPWRVYITFNDMYSQRQCLNDTGMTGQQVYAYNKSGQKPVWGLQPLKKEAVLQGHVMETDYAHEPDEIYYKHANTTPYEKLRENVKSYLVCAIFVVICYYIVAALSEESPTITAIYISLINAIIPELVKAVDAREIHLNASDAQLSAMLKLTVTRCFNSGVLIYLSVDYEDRFSEEALSQIQGIMIADAITTPFLRFLDLPGLYNRHIKGKSAVTQDQLNLLWAPQKWSLADRYTDTLKTIFIGMIYAVPLPSALFITSFAMMSAYVVDKYSLFRVWERPSSLDHQLAALASYFFFIVLWMHVFFSRLFFANWPFGYHVPADCGFFFCYIYVTRDDDYNTDHLEREGDSHYMVNNAYNLMNMGYFVVSVVITYFKFKNQLFGQYYSPKAKNYGEGSHDKFRKLHTIPAYVPFVIHPSLTKPILFADVGDLPLKYAPVYDHADALRDAPKDINVFSVVNSHEFPLLTYKDLVSVFSEVAFYDEEEPHEYVGGSGAGNAGEEPAEKAAPVVVSKKPSIRRREKEARKETLTVDDDGNQLPPGWGMKKTAEGRPYYVNHMNRTTQWIRPTHTVF